MATDPARLIKDTLDIIVEKFDSQDTGQGYYFYNKDKSNHLMGILRFEGEDCTVRIQVSVEMGK